MIGSHFARIDQRGVWWKHGAVAMIGFGLLGLGFLEPTIALPNMALLCIAWACVAWWQGLVTGLGLLVPATLGLVSDDPLVLAGACSVGLIIGCALLLLALGQGTTPASLALRARLNNGRYQQKLLERQLQRYPRLMTLGSALFNAQERGQLAKTITDHVYDLIPQAQQVCVTIGQGGHEEYSYLRGHRGAHSSRLPAATHGSADELSERRLRAERYCLAEQRMLIEREENEIHISLPLRGDRRGLVSDQPVWEQVPRGVLWVRCPSQGLEDYLLIDILSALARMAGLSLASVALLEEARSLALFDDLTGLFGQHEFLRRLDELLAQQRRQGSGRMAGVMCDMDHLKRFNDTWGHPAGDAALRAIAALIQHSLPTGGFACRYGGEEFAVCLPDVACAQAWTEGCRQAIEDLRLDGDARVTASMGWTGSQADDNARSLLDRADNACYAAKSAGRNRVCEADHD